MSLTTEDRQHGIELRASRKAAGLSLADLSESTGLPMSLITKAQRGKRYEPEVEQKLAAAIARASGKPAPKAATAAAKPTPASGSSAKTEQKSEPATATADKPKRRGLLRRKSGEES